MAGAHIPEPLSTRDIRWTVASAGRLRKNPIQKPEHQPC